MTQPILVPTTLDQWSADSLRGLLAAGFHETEEVEWKSQLQDPNARLADCAAAMANGRGGFILFGVDNDAAKPAASRLVGIDRALDFPKLFNDHLNPCDPRPLHEFRQPPIETATRRLVIQVVHVLPSTSAHSVGGTFFKRIPGSTIPMSTTEVRDLVLRREELRAKARLLLIELASAREAAVGVAAFANAGPPFPLRAIDTSNISRLHADLAPLLSTEISRRLLDFRSLADGMNFQLQILRESLSFRRAPDDLKRDIVQVVTNHNLVANLAEQLVPAVAQSFGEAAPRLLNESEIRHRAY